MFICVFQLFPNLTKHLTLHDKYYLNQQSYITISHHNDHTYAEHFTQFDSTAFSTFGGPMLLYKSSGNDHYFKNKNFKSQILLLNDSLGIFSFNKARGEIDEAFLIKSGSTKITRNDLCNYCKNYTDSLGSFSVPSGFSGFMYIIFDQKKNFQLKKEKALIFSTTKSLDLRAYMCKNYEIKNNLKRLDLEWSKELYMPDDQVSHPDGEVLGLNHAFYLEVLNDLGINGEVLAFKIK